MQSFKARGRYYILPEHFIGYYKNSPNPKECAVLHCLMTNVGFDKVEKEKYPPLYGIASFYSEDIKQMSLNLIMFPEGSTMGGACATLPHIGNVIWHDEYVGSLYT